MYYNAKFTIYGQHRKGKKDTMPIQKMFFFGNTKNKDSLTKLSSSIVENMISLFIEDLEKQRQAGERMSELCGELIDNINQSDQCDGKSHKIDEAILVQSADCKQSLSFAISALYSED